MAKDLKLRELSKAEIDAFRPYVWDICKTKEELKSWITIVLGIDLPDCIVDPNSNSTPLDICWEVYETCTQNKENEKPQFMAYAARSTFKTLSASIIETLLMCHDVRNIAHLSAIRSQSLKSREYVQKFLNRPLFREFVTSKNSTTLELTRYRKYDDHRKNLTEKQWKSLSSSAMDEYEEIRKSTIIVIGSLSGANCIDGRLSVLTRDRGLVQIKDVTPGEFVKGFDLQKRSDEWFCVGNISTTTKPSVCFEVAGKRLLSSEDHMWFTSDGWRQARNLRVGHNAFIEPTDVFAPSPTSIIFNDSVKIDNPNSVILGSLLGDSTLCWPKNKKKIKYGRGPRFSLSHCVEQVSLLNQVKTAISNLGISFIDRFIPKQKRSGGWNANESHGFLSKTSKDFVPLYNLLYPNDKKVVTREILDKLDLEAIAYWLMDDAMANKVEVGVYKSRPITIATCGFTHEEQDIIVKYFKERWDIECWVILQGNQSDVKYDCIKFSMESSRRLSGMIDDYILPALKYKIPSPFIDTRCIDCDELSSLKKLTNGFWRCAPCAKKDRSTNQRRNRIANKEFHNKIKHPVNKIQFVGNHELYDLHIDSEFGFQRNFWVYIDECRILSHNSAHTPFLCVDEVDTFQDKVAYEEAKLIPDTSPEGKMPVTLYTSTRKTSFGLVQRELDDAEKNRTTVRHWSLLDCTQRCEPERHQPELPTVPLYVNEDILKSIGEEDFKILSKEQQSKYQKIETAFAGCVKCPLHAMCKGNLVNQKSNSIMLKSIENTINTFARVSVNTALAQLLCLKPSTEGLIYPALDPDIHKLTAAEMAEEITGLSYPDAFTKYDLILLAKALNLDFFGGLDFGSSHSTASAAAIKHGNRLFIIQYREVPGLDVIQQSELLEYERDVLNCSWFPDMAGLANIKSLKRMGHTIFSWKKGPGSLLEGIENVRAAIRPVLGKPSLYFLKDDDGCELAFKRLNEYHWKLSANGKPSDIPDDFEDDGPDCCRYLVMNALKSNRQTKMITDADTSSVPPPTTPNNYISSLIDDALGNVPRSYPNSINSVSEKSLENTENQPKLIKKKGFRMV